MSCESCEVEPDLPYRCNYCGGVYCPSHRLPEEHDCDGVEFLTDSDKRFKSKFSDEVVTDEADFRSPEPLEPEDIRTVGTTKEPDYSSGKSPPVEINRDGGESKEEESGGLLSRLFDILR